MDNAASIVRATLQTLLLTQVFRPIVERGGPAADFAVEAFARTVVESMEKRRG